MRWIELDETVIDEITAMYMSEPDSNKLPSIDTIADYFGITRSQMIHCIISHRLPLPGSVKVGIPKTKTLRGRKPGAVSKYTTEKVQWIKDQISNGATSKEIAVELGVSPNAVYATFKQLGINVSELRPKLPSKPVKSRSTQYQRWCPDRIGKLQTLMDEGTPVQEIAAYFGQTVSGMNTTIRRLGVKSATKRRRMNAKCKVQPKMDTPIIPEVVVTKANGNTVLNIRIELTVNGEVVSIGVS